MAFGVSGCCALVAVPLLRQLNVQVHKNTESMWPTAKAVSAMLDVNIFFLIQIIIGLCWGFHMFFLPVYVDELNASKTLLGAD